MVNYYYFNYDYQAYPTSALKVCWFRFVNPIKNVSEMSSSYIYLNMRKMKVI